MSDSFSFSISKNAIKTAALAMICFAVGAAIVFAAFDIGRDIENSRAAAERAAIEAAASAEAAQEAAVQATVTVAPSVPIPTSATFTVYQKFEDVNGVQWVQTTANDYYRVAFVNDYRRAEEGYTYYAEFTGQITGGHQTVGTMSYVSGAPVRVYSSQDNEWHTIYHNYDAEYWPMGSHDMSAREYQDRVVATLYNGGW